MISWSDYNLPNPKSGMGIKLKSAVVRTEMESGRTRQRQRFTVGNRIIPVSFSFDDTEFPIFQAVFEYKLNNGADWFTMSLPLGDGFNDFTVRFDGEWSATEKAVLNWTVSANLEVESGSTLSEAELDALFPEE